jgi:hypothetical protein
MKSFLLYLTFILSSVPFSVYCQEDEYKTFKHQALGIEFRYRDIDDTFSDERRIAVPPLKWKKVNVSQFKLSIKLPSGFIVRTEPADLPSSGPICDSSLFKYSADIVRVKYKNHKGNSNSIHIYFSNMEFPEIALENNYVKDDSGSWALDSGMMGQEEAIYLDGTMWKGLRGSIFARSGKYTQRVTTAFLVYQYGKNCNLVITYYDPQLNANALSETEFYDIVSTIKFYVKY